MAIHTNKAVGDALAQLFQAEFEKTMDRQMVLLNRIHYGECYTVDGGDTCPACEAMKPKPLKRRVKVWRWMKTRLWYRPWGVVHRLIPGECRCEYCEEDHG
jgi:hypothetical protein